MEFKPIASSSSGNCYILSDGGESIMIEAGIPWRKVQEALNFQTRDIRFCLVSHAHGDHAGHVKDVLKVGIDCWGPSIPIEHHRFFDLDVERFNEIYIYDGWFVKTFRCVHDVPCVGFLIARGPWKVLYLPDTQYSPYKFGPGLTHLLLSVNYAHETIAEDIDPAHRKHIIHDHMSLRTAKALLAANDLSAVREIWLLHLSRDNSDAEKFKREIEQLTGKPVFVAGE